MFQEQNWTHMPVAAIGAITGDVYYRKNYFSNTLHIMGSISITASATPTPPEYIAFALLPAGYRPLSADVPFKAFFRYHLSTLEDASSLDYIRDMNMELTTTGNLSIGLIKPAANCIVSFNTILPLD